MPSLAWRAAAAAAAHPAIPDRYRPTLLRRIGVDVGHAEIRSGCHIGSKLVRFGDGVFINHRCYFDGDAPIAVGDRVALGPDCRILTAGHTVADRTRRCSPQPVRQPVTIGDGAWLAAGVTVLPGVTVAAGCVVGAGSVVTRSTERDGLYVGSPARRVRHLA